jgi:hypothetical protein
MFEAWQQLYARRHCAAQSLRDLLREAPSVFRQRRFRENGFVRFWREYQARTNPLKAPKPTNGRLPFVEDRRDA